MSLVPYAISRLGANDTRESQNIRAVEWLLEQPGGPIVVVTPKRDFSGNSLKRLVELPGVIHYVWRGFIAGSFDRQRVLSAWPDRKHLNDVWGIEADAVVVIEWNMQETAEWIEDSSPIQLLPDQTVAPFERKQSRSLEQLRNGVDGILTHIARMAAGYSSGLKWNEEDMLKADMMNRPERWIPMTVDQVRAKYRALGMRADDVDKVAGFLQRRKDGRRFNVRSSYRTHEFK